LERLESRTLLAGDLMPGLTGAEGEDPAPDLVSIQLEATDPITGSPVDQVRPGDRINVAAYVEDMRASAQGVYAAYLDLLYPTSQFRVDGTPQFTGPYANGPTGDYSKPGIVDEVGAFSSQFAPLGGGRHLLFTIALQAVEAGDAVITADPADALPAHDVLLFGRNAAVPQQQIEYHSLPIEVVTGGVTDDWVEALDDFAAVVPGSRNNVLVVVANDAHASADTPTVIDVDTGGISGQVRIGSDFRSLSYTPPTGFQGVEQFRYTVVNASGDQDSATVTVEVTEDASLAEQVAIQLEVTGHDGQMLDTVSVGDTFLIQAYVSDQRSGARGVYAAYLDLLYAAEMLEVRGPVQTAVPFGNGVSGDLQIPGLGDEIGAFSTQFAASGPGAQRLFALEAVAVAPGFGGLQADPSDELPQHDVLVYGSDEEVSQARIVYDFAPLRVLPSITAVDDSYHVASAGSPLVLEVLENDVHSTSETTISSVDGSGLTGNLQIAGDGKSLVYTAPAGFGGTEQFTYTATAGSDADQATVTLHFDPGALADDVAEIRLEVTDLGGTPVTSVAAGEQFLVRAVVDDLRDAGIDLGLFAAYFDLLYDRHRVSVVEDSNHRLGFDVEFGSLYGNGQTGDAMVPGIIDEAGAFQTGELPLGSGEQLLFQAAFVANTVIGIPDQFSVMEDSQGVALDVLANDLGNQGETVFRADPADASPVSDVLPFNPPEALSPAEIRFQDATLGIVTSSTPVITSVGPGTHGGQVAISPGGTGLIYSPAADFFGTETFAYTLDGTTQVEVAVQVTGVNDAPTATSDSYPVQEGGSLQVQAARGVLLNDVDVDGDPLEAEVVELPQYGVLQLSRDGAFTYTPDTDFFGQDQFSYQVTDGAFESLAATVTIHVQPPPVSVRLAATDAAGQPVSSLTAGEPLFVHTRIQDLREDEPIRGIGAAYIDLRYDADAVSTIPSQDSVLGFAIEFGPAYQNGIEGDLDTPGLINDVGAFQTDFSPTGPHELELVRVEFDTTAARAMDDSYRVSKNSQVNLLDVMTNEMALSWQAEFVAEFAANSPSTDFVFYNPPEPVDEADIHFGRVTVEVFNGSQLEFAGLGSSANGGSVTLDAGSKIVRYAPPANFVGQDSFTYTIRNEAGGTATATVRIDVVDSWTNQHLTLDVNSDGSISPGDALVIINELNENGGRPMPFTYDGPFFFDTNGDQSMSTIDVLLVLNYLNDEGAAEGEASPRSDSLILTESRVIDDPLEHIYGTNALLDELLSRSDESSEPVLSRRFS
jgi:hypothetical protein